MTRSSFVTALLVPLLMATTAGAEVTQCTPITAIPTTLYSPGIYCLTGDLLTGITSGAAIDIKGDNITIELNGHRLGGGSAGSSTTASGIRTWNSTGTVIRNGSIKGFYAAVALSGGRANLVEGIRADGNYVVGINSTSTQTVIRNNQISNTGGSTAQTSAPWAHGILATGQGTAILNNNIANVASTGDASGIAVVSNDCVVNSNRISTVSSATRAYGIHLSTSKRPVAVGNVMTGVQAPASTGIRGGNDVIARDNQINGYATGIDGLNGVASGNQIVGATIAITNTNRHGTTNWP